MFTSVVAGRVRSGLLCSGGIESGDGGEVGARTASSRAAAPIATICCGNVEGENAPGEVGAPTSVGTGNSEGEGTPGASDLGCLVAAISKGCIADTGDAGAGEVAAPKSVGTGMDAGDVGSA
eukprot:1590909-Amphidinium_carterae.1